MDPAALLSPLLPSFASSYLPFAVRVRRLRGIDPGDGPLQLRLSLLRRLDADSDDVDDNLGEVPKRAEGAAPNKYDTHM